MSRVQYIAAAPAAIRAREHTRPVRSEDHDSVFFFGAKEYWVRNSLQNTLRHAALQLARRGPVAGAEQLTRS